MEPIGVFDWIKIHGCASHTSASSPQRIDAIENLSTFEFAQMKGVIFIEKKAAIDALLRKGDPR